MVSPFRHYKGFFHSGNIRIRSIRCKYILLVKQNSSERSFNYYKTVVKERTFNYLIVL